MITGLITAFFIVAALVALVEAWLSRDGRPYLAIGVAIGFIGAIIWRLQ